jgi:hypothetical protein
MILGICACRLIYFFKRTFEVYSNTLFLLILFYLLCSRSTISYSGSRKDRTNANKMGENATVTKKKEKLRSIGYKVISLSVPPFQLHNFCAFPRLKGIFRQIRICTLPLLNCHGDKFIKKLC